MVRCSKCGTENANDTRYCTKCGNALYPERRPERRDDCFGPRRDEDECFGIPYGLAVVGALVGLLIVVVGIGTLVGWNIGQLLGGFFLIVLGVLIILAVYSSYRRRWSTGHQ